MTRRLKRGRWVEDGKQNPAADAMTERVRMARPKALVRVDETDANVTTSDGSKKAPRSLAGARRITRRALAHALASNLKNVIMSEFKPHNATHGVITITMTYPYKPSKAMPK